MTRQSPVPSPQSPVMATTRQDIPVPDPTVLTTQLLLREVAGLRDTIEARLKCVEENMEHQRERIETRHEAIKEEVSHLEKLHGEKFNSFNIRLNAQDKLADKIEAVGKEAVTAAFAAAKEAVATQQTSNTTAINKSDKDTTDKIAQMGLLSSNNITSLSDKIDVVGNRITSIESNKKGGGEVWAAVAVIATLILSAAGIVAAIIATRT